jgi:DNA-binding NtrC family response regulator
MPHAATLLLVDDDRALAQSMAEWLTEQGLRVQLAFSFAEGRKRLAAHRYELLLTDLRLGDGDGMDLIDFCHKQSPETAILALSGYATPETAMQAIRRGAFDLLTKPLIDDELRLAIDRALTRQKVEAENQRLKAELDRRLGLEHILSHDYRMQRIFDVIESIADARASVLITGENGTGKSMVARAIHRRSKRREQSFVEVACGALPDALLESELFGHVTGAFTGAVGDRMGKFKQADGGTLFLDEIGTASTAMQVKLLRVLQEFQFEPVGSSKTETVDARVILATNENLTAAVAAGRFRQDLYYRVNVIRLELPSLRQRAGDIPVLADHFVRQACQESGRSIEGFDREAIQRMQQYAWPGNVRELENVVERAVLLARGNVLTVDDLPPEILDPGGFAALAAAAALPASLGTSIPASGTNATNLHVPPPAATGSGATALRSALAEPEKQIILQTLREHRGNRAAAALALGINRTTLYKKMRRLGIEEEAGVVTRR